MHSGGGGCRLVIAHDATRPDRLAKTNKKNVARSRATLTANAQKLWHFVKMSFAPAAGLLHVGAPTEQVVAKMLQTLTAQQAQAEAKIHELQSKLREQEQIRQNTIAQISVLKQLSMTFVSKT